MVTILRKVPLPGLESSKTIQPKFKVDYNQAEGMLPVDEGGPGADTLKEYVTEKKYRWMRLPVPILMHTGRL